MAAAAPPTNRPAAFTPKLDGSSKCPTWYELEVGGAMLAGKLATLHNGTRPGTIFELIRQLEQRTAGWIGRILDHYHALPVLAPDLNAAMDERAQRMAVRTWQDVVSDLRQEFEDWLIKLRESETNVPPEFASISRHLIFHEQVLCDFARLEAAGEWRTSVDGLHLLLDSEFEARV